MGHVKSDPVLFRSIVRASSFYIHGVCLPPVAVIFAQYEYSGATDRSLKILTVGVKQRMSRFGPAVKRQACDRKDVGSRPLWLSFLNIFSARRMFQRRNALFKCYLLLLLLQLYCSIGISPTGNSGCFPRGKLAATESRYPINGI